MRSEVRIGRLKGSGAVINLTTAGQVVGGLSVTLDIPKGHVALVTYSGITIVNNSVTIVELEVDGAIQSPGCQVSDPANGTNEMLGQSWLLTAGRRAVRVLCRANAAAGVLDPNTSMLSWIIAPQGGIAS